MDTPLDRPRWRTTASLRVVPTLQVGAELNPAAGEIGPIATWFFLTEQGARPAAFVGTSSDRIGSPEGTQSYYLTVAKNLDPVPLSVYGTINYSEWDAGFNVPFGASLEVLPGTTIQPIYDGRRTHLLASWAAERFSVSAMLAWLERVGVAVSWGF